MIAKIKAQFPNLDTSEQSVFTDLFINPMKALFQPVVAELNGMEIRDNLDNAEYMTEDELDKIGVGNYLIARNVGQESTATVTLSFATISNIDNLVIPAGIIFSTPSGLNFQLSERKEFTPTELYTMYNPQTMQYDVEVTVTAMDVGSKYNVAEGQINKCESVFNNSLVAVINKSPATGGTDKESNVDYAARMREYYVSRHLGTPYGYRQFIFENFPEVEDVYISGYGDKYMERDQLMSYNPETTEITSKHIGGKVDVYLKGSNFRTSTTTLQLNSNNMILSAKLSNIVSESIRVVNDTDQSKIVVWNVTPNADGNAVVKMINTGDQSFDSSIVNNISVRYKITAADSTIVDKVEYFNVGISAAELDQPFKDILNVQDVSTGLTYNDIKYYSIVQSGIIGTSQEENQFTFSGLMEDIPNGHMFSVSYTINDTINSLDKVFNMEENRIVTTDILFKEAEVSFINLSFKVKLKDGKKLDSITRNTIQTSLAEFFKQCKLGQQVQESDIVAWLYNDENTSAIIDFVSLPFISFYVAEDPQLPIAERRDNTYLNMEGIQYPVLNKIEIIDL
jgi:hypothetical protein